MAKNTRRLNKDELPVSNPEQEQLSDIELQEVAATAAAAESTGKEGTGETTSDRLPYMVLTSEAMAYLHEVASWLTREVRKFVPMARDFGAPLPVEQVQRIAKFDTAFNGEVVCTGNGCEYSFRPRAIAEFRDDGMPETDERVKSESNPEGVSYRGAFSVVRENPENRHSRLKAVGHLCRKCQSIGGNAYFQQTGKRPRTLAAAEAQAFVNAENAKKEQGRLEHLERRAKLGATFGVNPNAPRKEEGYRSRPHMATGGRPGRGRELPDSSGISNRGPRR